MWLHNDWPRVEKIGHKTSEEDDGRAIYRIMPNDPILEHLHLDDVTLDSYKEMTYKMVLEALKEQRFLAKLTMTLNPGNYHPENEGELCHSHDIMHSLSQNTSINHLTLLFDSLNFFGLQFGRALSKYLVVSSLRTLSILPHVTQSFNNDNNDNITAMVEVLSGDRKIMTFEIDNVFLNEEMAILFAGIFHQNKIIKHLNLKNRSFLGARSALAFVRALPDNHALESIHFGAEMVRWFNKREQVSSIVEVLCCTHISNLSITGVVIHYNTYNKIMTNLQQVPHHFTKLDVVYEKEWRKEIERETYLNHSCTVGEKWMDNYLAQRPKVPTKVDLCIAIERAKKADQDTILKSQNTLYSLMKGLMSNPPQVEVIKDGMIKHKSMKREYYFTLDESGFPEKRIHYSED